MSVPVTGRDWTSRQVVVRRDLPLPAPPSARSTLYRLSGTTMGTTWSVRFAGEPGVVIADLHAAIDRRLHTVVGQMSTWLDTSVLSRFNRSAHHWIEVPDEMMAVLQCALAIAAASGGAFDPTVGLLVDAWGFGPAGSRTDAPAQTAIDDARERGGWQRIDVDAAGRRARQPGGIALDFSSIAKGFAVDLVAAALAEHGVGNCLVEIGGELRGHGVKPDGQPWWIRIESPPPSPWMPNSHPHALDIVIALYGQSVATSGDYRRGFEHNRSWFSHVIDPRSGRPVTHETTSVSVMADTCMQADAWSTALLVLGVEAGLAMADDHDLAALFVERTHEGWRVHASSAFEIMLDD